MSLHRSVGDLVPQDIAEILARERHSSKGRKRRGGSLSRAFRWLKSRRKKKGGASAGANGPARVAGDGKAGKHAHQHDTGKGLPKQEQETRPSLSPLYPENVFIEGDRPQFLQALHTEAQEGLKILLQEEDGMDYQDDESFVSTATRQTGDDTSLASSVRTVGSGDTTTGAMSTVSTVSAVSGASMASAISAVSEVSAVSAASTVSTQSSRSTRSGLTRQGSTFKPLSGSRRPEKNRRRSKRATVAGIPQHVQRELGLDRGSWPSSPTEEQLPNGQDAEEEVDMLPDPGLTPEGVRIHLAALESAEEEQLLRRHLQAMQRGDLAIARTAGPRLSPGRRVKSVAVPGLTTASSAAPPPGTSPVDPYPASPVMYMSPQATYMSKIIPNAVLPGEVDVIEITRKGRSRGSVRTLSKTSLTAPSPALSRASWSGSDSSHTVVSDSSTISSGGGHSRRAKRESGPAGGAHPGCPDQVSLHSSISYSSNITSVSQVGGDSRKSDAYFGRSLSVKKSKKDPPAPPRRTNSLHPSKLRRRSRDVLDTAVPSPSPAYSADQSQISSSSSSSTLASLPKMQGKELHRTLSPSSGYSSQSPGPTLSPYTGNPTQQGAQTTLPKGSSLITTILGFRGPALDIPPHPNVKAPTPPPPETWIHDQRSFNLLCGPLSVQRNLFVALQKVRLERQRKHVQCPLVAAGEVSGASQRKEPPPVMKKTGVVRMELKHISPIMVNESSTLMQVYVQTPPPSPPPVHHPPPPPTKETSASSVSDSAWPLPPPPPVELLPGAVFEGPDETALLPPPPLQEGPGSPPMPANVKLIPPMKTIPPVTATPTSVNQVGTIMPNNTAEVTQALVQPGIPLACSTNSLDMSLLLQGIPPPPKEAPPPPPDTRPVLQGVPPPPLGIPPPPQEAPPPPPETQPVLQGVPAPPLEIPPPPQEAPPPPPDDLPVSKEVQPPPLEAQPLPQDILPPPQEAPTLSQESLPAPQEVMLPPQEALSVPLEVLPPAVEVPPVPQVTHILPVEAPPVAQEFIPPPQEAPPVPQEILPPPLEAPPVPQDVLPPPLEAPPVPQEVLPPPLEAPPVPQEVLPPPLEAPPVTQEVLPPPLEAPPVPQEVLPPPLEAPTVPQEVLPPPKEVLSVPQEVMPLPQESPTIPQEVLLPPQEALLPPQEALPVEQECLCPAQEVPPEQKKVLHPAEEATPVSKEDLPSPPETPPVPEEVLLPPQVAPPVPEEVLLPPQEAPPVLQEVSPAPEEIRTSFPEVPTVLPSPSTQPVEELTTLTSPVELGPAIQEAQNREPKPKISHTPKRDAHVPMTTSTLLQMVRIRAGESTGAPVLSSKLRDAGEKPGQGQNQKQNQADEQSGIERPKTLPVTAQPHTNNYPPPATGSAPSMKLQEAIRMKTAAMSRLGARSPPSASPSRSSSSPSPSPSPVSPSPSSPASTASFIFARSTRKVIIETPSSPEGQAGLKADLAAELARMNGPAKNAKVPPPVAKKPSHHNDPAPPPNQTQGGLPSMAIENGGVAAPPEEMPAALPKEIPESSNAKSAGDTQPASTDHVSLSPPP